MELNIMVRRLVGLQVLLGIMAFCVAKEDPSLLLFSSAVAMFSWYLVDGPNGRPMPSVLINLGCVGAVAVLVWEFLQGFDNLLPAMGQFMLWLQVVLLYGKKTNREYGQLFVLSVLQMTGAAMISVSFLFGMFTAVYCAVALVSILLMQMKVVQDDVTRQNQLAAPHGVRAVSPKAIFCRGHKWQFRLIALCLAIVCGSVGMVSYLFTPRTNEQLSGLGLARHSLGFSTKITLGETPPKAGGGHVEIVVTASRNNVPMVESDTGFLLRGSALDRYDPLNRTWSRSLHTAVQDAPVQWEDPEASPKTARIVPLPKHIPMMQAQIWVRNQDMSTLFTLHPIAEISTSDIENVRFNPVDQQMGVEQVVGQSASYSVTSPVTPPRGFFDRYSKTSTPRGHEAYHEQWRIQPERVKLLASDILMRAGLTLADAKNPETQRAVAQALSDYLQKNYTYSLDTKIPPNEDPVIHFLFRTPSGHCELFASALTALARSVGLDARLVTGYRVSEYNAVGDYFVVRPRNSHAWSEIYCDQWGWLTFDATPAQAVAQEHMPQAGLLGSVQQWYEYVEYLWLHFAGYNQRNQITVYADSDNWLRTKRRQIDNAVSSAYQSTRLWFRRWQLGPAMIAIIATLVFFVIVGTISAIRGAAVRRRRLVALQLTRLPRQQRRALARQLRFYLIMLDTLERYGFVRPAWQSPYSFAQDLTSQQAHCFAPVVELTELFYEIRFGHRTLDSERKQSVKSNLAQLEENLSQRR